MADLVLSGIVGDEIVPKDVQSFLTSTTDQEITVYLNSPGGSVWDGLEIYNLLRASGRHIKTVLTGLAASMGSIIFLAGDERMAMTGTLYMVHKPSSLSWGNADDMRKTIEMLDKSQDSLGAIYKERTGIEDIHEYINAESWFNAEDMQRLGITNSTKVIKMENILSRGDVEDMAKIDDLKAEKEQLEAEKAQLEEQLEEARLETEVNNMRADIAKMKAQTESVSESEDEADDTDNEDNDEVTDTESADEDENEDTVDTGTNDEQSELEVNPAAKIDTTKTVAKKSNNKIPAFMQVESKY